MDIEKKVLEFNGFEAFNPMQSKALKKNLFEKNLVISAPTASGKTIVAELCALNSIINNKKKVLYCCPLRALASEHFNDFKKKYSQLDIRIAISTGDFDSSSKYLSNYDWIIVTYEKLDSLIRHRADWLNSVGLLIIDEVHELDSDRGPVIELISTKLQLMNPKLQILALSATIPNAKDLAQWLNAELVESDFRPVKLREGVFFNELIHFVNAKEKIALEEDELSSLALDTLEKKKQALVFCNTRKSAIANAKKLSHLTQKMLSGNEKAELLKKSEQVLNVLENPTEQCRLLSDLLKKGIAFHHAGLLGKQRTIVEELFKSNHLKILAATPTLAAGVNLPAFRVIIPSLYRYEVFGMNRIPVREYKQWVGRAGRPAYNDPYGEGILIAKNEIELDELRENFVLGELESIESKLGFESVLRTQLLSAIASDFVFDLDSLEKFFSKTFYAFQFGNLEEIFLKLNDLLKELNEMQFIDCSEKKFKATLLGKRVSELYLDPLSAFSIINALKKEKLSNLSFLFLVSSCNEFFPLQSVSKLREAELWEQLQEFSAELPIDLEEQMFFDSNLLRKFNSALMLNDWIEEVTEENLNKSFKILPGILYAKMRIADWLTYCCFELAKLLEKKQHFIPLNKLRKRLKHGVKEELLQLVELKGIGRVRARRLFRANIRTISDLKKIDLTDLSRVLGSKTALNIKKQLKQA